MKLSHRRRLRWRLGTPCSSSWSTTPRRSPPAPAPPPALDANAGDPILGAILAEGARPNVTYRRQGDRHLLVEYGPIVLDLELRLRVHALMLELQALALPGIL